MTAPLLLSYIFAAILLQVGGAMTAALWRRRRSVAGDPVSDGNVVQQSRAWPGWRDFRVAQREYEDAAQTQCSFYLAPVDGKPLPPFMPGQHLTFSLQISSTADGSLASPKPIVRCYSLSDRPDALHYRITIKRAVPPPDRPDAPPGISSGHFHDHVEVGDTLRVKAPAGHFFIDPDSIVPAVLIAGGIGVTPMMSILLSSLTAQPARTIHLFYGVRNSADHAFKQVFEQLAASHPNFHLTVLYERPDASEVKGRDYHSTGFIDVELLRRSLPHGRHIFYVCGPPAMMTSLVPALAAWGVLPADIRTEAFGPAAVRSPPVPEPAAEAFEIQFVRSGRTIPWTGRETNLLDFAERHGIAVESGCRSGSCGTCETKLVSGTVSYADKPDFEAASGRCLLCVGKPQSNLLLEA